MRERGPRDIVVRDIMRGLYEGRYRPGQRLIESQLTVALGVSRGPVREALNHLAAIGAVELTPQRGARVRLLKIEEAIDILVVAQALVSVAARLAAFKSNGADAPQLAAALERFQDFSSTNAGPDYAVARNSFYATLTELSGSDELRRMLRILQIDLVRVQFGQMMQNADDYRLADYKDIANAILAGELRAAERAASLHFSRAIKALSDVI